jgi:hypothetical protein
MGFSVPFIADGPSVEISTTYDKEWTSGKTIREER